ncbi:MAG TPA: site-specific integrase [Thermoanaerobaculaceae bacterium]|nr:site-specific integrase [Thermoanaerobaculaceae bacterium]HPS76768.1 site-specific integrase [Thermoanaerobaculaceae bacterium]
MPTLVQAARPFQLPTLAGLDEATTGALEHMTTVEGLRPTTLSWVRVAYRGFRTHLATNGQERLFLSGDLQAQGRVFDDWVAAGRTRGLSHVTLNNNWRALRLVLSRVAREGGMLNPMDFFQAPRFTRPLPRVLPRPVAEQVLSIVRNYPWRDTFERSRQLVTVGLMLLAGLRRGEVLRLQYGDVDADACTIRIVRGKGRHGGKDRTAYMTPQLAEMVRAYDEERRRRNDVHPAFLLATRPSGPVGLRSIKRLFKIVSAGVGTHVTPHALRHSYATLLRQAGVPDRVAMELLGHSSLQMVQRYSHVFSGEEREAAARLVLSVDGEPAMPDPAG